MSWIFLVSLWLTLTIGVVGPLAFDLIDCEGCEAVNPLWIYKHYNLSWFGAICLCILYHLLAPVYAIGYWIYKLYTVGRR
jgi:hypothetical protein